MRKAVADVIEFRRAVGLEIGDRIHIPDGLYQSSDFNVVVEEFRELHDAVLVGTIEEIADGGVDLIVTVIGLLVRCGIDPAEIWDEVQRSNLSKVGGGKRADGKAMKGPDYSPPDIQGALDDQCSLDAIYPVRGVLGGSGDTR